MNWVHPVRRGSGRCRGNTTWRSDHHAGLKLRFWCAFQLLRRPEKSIPHFSDQLQIWKRVSQTASRRARSGATKGVCTDLFLILTTPSTSLMLLLGGVRSVLEMQSPFGGRSAADDGLPQRLNLRYHALRLAFLAAAAWSLPQRSPQQTPINQVPILNNPFYKCTQPYIKKKHTKKHLNAFQKGMMSMLTCSILEMPEYKELVIYIFN